jgi:hypothetical protein
LFAHQADIVAQSDKPFEQSFCLVDAPEHDVGIDEPKAASKKHTLPRLQSIVALGLIDQFPRIRTL